MVDHSVVDLTFGEVEPHVVDLAVKIYSNDDLFHDFGDIVELLIA